MDKEQKNTDAVKPDIQHQEEAFKIPVVKKPVPQESDLKKVLKPEVLDL